MMAAFQKVAARRVVRGAPRSRDEQFGAPMSDSEWSLSPEYTSPLSDAELALIHAGGAPDFEFGVPQW